MLIFWCDGKSFFCIVKFKSEFEELNMNIYNAWEELLSVLDTSHGVLFFLIYTNAGTWLVADA
jgi:hypothetical protein